MVSFAAKIAKYIRKHGLIAPGDRIGVAVSGGADSVALLRALLELRGELGCVLAVVHFNHKIRTEADSDAEFVQSLARQFGLEFFGGAGDAKAFARERRVSLETAARELRYGFLGTLSLDKVATAHTLDDQAETVLMKVVRGAGTKGLSGIWPCVRRQAAGGRRQENRTAEGGCATQPMIVRPMLGVRRREVEAYLRSLGQAWREDATNRDVKHTRNKVRHELLPLLEAEYNPNIYQQLADAAEVARAEEECWDAEVQDFFSAPGLKARSDLVSDAGLKACSPSKTPRHGPSTREERSLGMTSVGASAGGSAPREQKIRAHGDVRAYTDSNGSETGQAPSLRGDSRFHRPQFLDLELLLKQPLALRRRVLRHAFEQASGKALDFEHTDRSEERRVGEECRDRGGACD